MNMNLVNPVIFQRPRAPLAKPAPPILARRIDVPASALGFTAPPCPVHMKFLRVGAAWTLVALTPPAKPPLAARWLETYQPASITIAPGLSPKVLRARFDKLPPAWETVLTTVVVHYLELTPEGSASLFVEDSPDKVERFLRGLRVGEPSARSRKTYTGPERVRLTARQLEVLSLAVALGYYEIPHKVNLRTLAKKVGLSLGAVSELLRRGEAIIVANYVDALSEAKWQAQQTTDAPPLVPPQ